MTTDGPALPPLTRPDGGPLAGADDLAAAQNGWRGQFGHLLYGPLPPAPDAVTVARHPLDEEPGCERLVLSLRVGARRFDVDAALWLPAAGAAPVPLVIGLGFLGPAGVLCGDRFPLDARAVVAADPVLGLHGGRLTDQVRGAHAARWPLPLFRRAGFGLLLSCYGSWVPDCPRRWQGHGLWPLLGLTDGPDRPGAISLWAWAFHRLVDAARMLPQVDGARIAVAGHSRLGKAALWATATDPRIAAVVANNAGCAGPALSRRHAGETLAHLCAAFPHWLSPRLLPYATVPERLPVDQHQLVACIAPRRVQIGSASADAWADPCGEYLGLRAAAPAWAIGAPMPGLPPAAAIWRDDMDARATQAHIAAGPLTWHLRPGGHALTPSDWRRYIDGLGMMDWVATTAPG